MRVGIRDIAASAACSYRTTLRAEADKEFVYGNLRSIARWICRRLHDFDA